MTKRHSIASFLKGGGESHCSLIHGRNIQALTSIDVLVNLLKQIDPVYESSDSIVYAKNTEYFAILFHAPNPRGEGEEERNMALIESYKKVIKHAIQAQCVDKIKDIEPAWLRTRLGYKLFTTILIASINLFNESVTPQATQ